MIYGIALFGLNGSGKSTLAHALAKQTGYFEMDAEDYYFPEQSLSRKWAIENNDMIHTEHLGDLPFSIPRAKQEVLSAIKKDIEAHPKFILSGVSMNWDHEILSHIAIAFWVQVPLKERLQRIQAREERRFGERVLIGGDMYTQQKDFLKMVENRDPKTLEESAESLPCPVATLDGRLPVKENLDIILRHCKRL